MVRIVIADIETNTIAGDLHIEAIPCDGIELIDSVAVMTATYINDSVNAGDPVSFGDFVLYLLAVAAIETAFNDAQAE